MRASGLLLVDVARDSRRTHRMRICFAFAAAVEQMLYNRVGATSERQRTAVSVVYGIEFSVVMKLKLTDEAEVCHFTSY